MTEGITHTQFRANPTFENPFCTSNNGLTKLGACINSVKPLLGASIEKRIHSMLKEFVCKSNSRYAKRFPRLKKLLNMVTAWADCMEASTRDPEVKQEMIKQVIEYMASNTLVTQFADPGALNNGPANTDPEVELLAEDQDVLKCRNVWRFINEKDFWHRQDCVTTASVEQRTNFQDHQCRKETSSSDLDVEVGSVSQESSTIYNTCRTASVCGQPCILKDKHRKPSAVKAGGRKVEFKFDPNQNQSCYTQQTINTFNIISCSTRERPKKYNQKSECHSKKFAQTQTSYQDLTFIFKCSNRNIVNSSNQTSNILYCPKPCPRKQVSQKSDAATEWDNDHRESVTNSKLKVYVHKTTSTASNKVRDSLKVSSISLPCKSNQLIVRLFEADPSLSDSCLILMRKKFEKDISNACSCVNDILKRLDGSAIKQLYLNCEIRPGRVDLNLQRRDRGGSRIRRFLARVPTCSNVHKRDSCHGSRENCDSLRDRCSEVTASKDLPVDPGCSQKQDENFKGRRISFCSDQNLIETKVPVSNSKTEEEKKGEKMNFVWTRRQEKTMEFLFPTGLANSQENEDFEVSRETDTDKASSKTRNVVYNDSNAGKEGYRQTEETVVAKQRSEVYNDGFTVEDSKNEVIELCKCRYNNFSSDSLKEDVYKEDDSITGVCNPDKCYCHVFCTNDTINKKEQETVQVNTSQTANFVKENQNVNYLYNLEEDSLRLQEERASKPEDTKDASVMEATKEVSKREEDTHKLDNVTVEVENNPRLEANNFHAEEKQESVLKVKEEFSTDSIYVQNSNSTDISCDMKCSCCGNDFSKSSLNEDVQTKTFVKLSDSKVHQASNSVAKERKTVSEDLKNFTILNTTPNTNIESNISTVPVRFFRVIDNARTDKSLTDRNYDQTIPDSSQFSTKKHSTTTQPLFVFSTRSKVKQSSSTSNFSTDDEDSLKENSPTRGRKAQQQFRPPMLKPRRRKSSCDPSYYPRNVPRTSSTRDHLKQFKARDEDSVPTIPRRRNRLWRGSMVPGGSLCSSFPAIDRIKYLIRKKLRKLLLEERDKGTSTSKTFLRNDRYLVSISSGKLSRSRAGSPNRCPFTTRNRYQPGGAPEKTFTEGSLLGRGRNAFGDVVRASYQRVIHNNDALKRIGITGEASKSLDRKHGSKSTDTRDLIGDKGAAAGRKTSRVTRDKGKLSIDSSVNQRNRLGVASLSLGGTTFVKDHGDDCLNQKSDKRNSYVNSKLSRMRHCCSRNYYEHGVIGSTLEAKKNGSGTTEDGTGCDKLRSFERRLVELERRWEEGGNLASTLSDYEKRINELDADFRLRLLQYVALCRSVKNSLMKKLQPDNVYEVSSSSM